MTRQEHLLTILAEECLEVAQRATKALRFGLEEIQPGQPLTNAERIREEYADLIGVYDLLIRARDLSSPNADQIAAKQTKVEKFLNYSQQCGTLLPTSDMLTPQPKIA